MAAQTRSTSVPRPPGSDFLDTAADLGRYAYRGGRIPRKRVPADTDPPTPARDPSRCLARRKGGEMNAGALHGTEDNSELPGPHTRAARSSSRAPRSPPAAPATVTDVLRHDISRPLAREILNFRGNAP